MYKPTFNMKRQCLVFRHFGNKGYSLFSCLGRIEGAPDQESGCENGNCTGPPGYCAGASTKC